MSARAICRWVLNVPEGDLLCALANFTPCPHGGDDSTCDSTEQEEYDPDTPMQISEVYPAISGEGTSTGMVCTIVRTVGCNLRCEYCDSVYAYEGGEQVALKDVVNAVQKYGLQTVLFTGGEPLLQEQVATHFLRAMLASKITTYIETNGSVNIWPHKLLGCIVMDIKPPSSGMHEKMLWNNLNYLGPTDEIKFVVANEVDYEYARQIIKERSLFSITPHIFISPAWSGGTEFFQELSQWMIRDRSEARFMLQQHKCVWGPEKRSV